MPYYIAKRKRTYIELVRIYAVTKKDADVMLEEGSGQILETTAHSTVSVIPKTIVFDKDAEQRARELFEQEQTDKEQCNKEQSDKE